MVHKLQVLGHRLLHFPLVSHFSLVLHFVEQKDSLPGTSSHDARSAGPATALPSPILLVSEKIVFHFYSCLVSNSPK